MKIGLKQTGSVALAVLLGSVSHASSEAPEQEETPTEEEAPTQQAPAETSGALTIKIHGFATNDGQAMARIYRPEDGVPVGKPYRITQGDIKKGTSSLVFDDLPFGSYGLIIAHDENGNGEIDHNILGIPKEALGFSGGFSISLFSGAPEFDDLRFNFAADADPLGLVVSKPLRMSPH